MNKKVLFKNVSKNMKIQCDTFINKHSNAFAKYQIVLTIALSKKVTLPCHFKVVLMYTYILE